MKSIEERADAASFGYYAEAVGYTDQIRCWGTDNIIKNIEEISKSAYIKGATEQKTIDDEEYRKDMRYVGVKREELIEKACRTYCRFCPHQCENYPHDDCQIQIELKNALEE